MSKKSAKKCRSDEPLACASFNAACSAFFFSRNALSSSSRSALLFLGACRHDERCPQRDHGTPTFNGLSLPPWRPDMMLEWC